MAWNWLRTEIKVEDAGLFPTYGAGDLTRQQAHEYVQDELNALAAFDPELRDVAAKWKRGAEDDTVYSGLRTWAIYEHPDGADPYDKALEWLQDYAQIMRSAGLPVSVYQRPER